MSFVERQTLMGSGCVNQALAQALGDVLKDYYIFVAQLETQHRFVIWRKKNQLFVYNLIQNFLSIFRLGELTLNKMWSYIQPTMDAMSFMADLCVTIDKCNARGKYIIFTIFFLTGLYRN